jgi:hypothetical protein
MKLRAVVDTFLAQAEASGQFPAARLVALRSATTPAALQQEAQTFLAAQLRSAEHGFDDYDIHGLPKVHRVAIGHGIQSGEIFNVYGNGGIKLGARWEGSLETSLFAFAANHPGYRELIAAPHVEGPSC